MNDSLAFATQIFVEAIGRLKSQHYPYLVDRTGPLWVMHDAPGRKDARKIEVVSLQESACETVELVRQADLGWHFLCDIQPTASDFSARREEYKQLGYRAVSTEWMFVHDLLDIPVIHSDPPVRIVRTQAEANSIPQTASHKLKLMPASREFRVWDETRDIGGVRSVDVEDAAWVSSLVVFKNYRRRSYGSALMSALLQADRDARKRGSVLLASSSGSKLYPLLGYRQIGILQMFCPADRS